MKILEAHELTQISGGDFYLGDNTWIHVSSAGIPSNAYTYIDQLQQQMFDGTISINQGVSQIINAGYAVSLDTYLTHVENGQFTIYHS